MNPAAILNIFVNANTGSASSQLAKLNTQLKTTAATADAASGAFMKSGARMQKAGTSMVAVGSKLTKYVSLPLVGIGVASGKMAADFDRSMSLISTQAGGTKREVAKLSKEVLNLAKNSKFSPNTLAQGLFHVESAGYRGAKAMGVLNEAQKLATVGNSDFEQTTYALVSAVKALGVEGMKPTKKIAAELNAIVGHGDTRMEELAASLSSGVIPAAKMVGLGLRDVGAALDVMTSRGMPAQMSATRLRMTLSQLATPSAKAATALKGIGLSSTDLAVTMRQRGLGPAVKELAEHLESLSKVRAASVISEAFGGGRTSAAIQLLVQNADELNKKYGEIAGSVHGYSRAVKEAEEQPMVKLEKAWSSIQVSLIKIGNVLLPAVVRAFSALAGIADKFSRLPAGIQQIAVEIGAVLVVAGPLLVVLGKITSVVGMLASGVGGLMEAGGGAGLAAIGGPEVLAAVAVVAALAAGLVILYRHSKTFRSAVDDAAKGASGLVRAFGPLVEDVKRGRGAFAAIGPVVKHSIEIATDVLAGFAKYLSGVFRVMKGIVEVFTGVLTGNFGEAWRGVKDIFAGGVKATLGILRAVTAPIRNIVSTIGDALLGGMKGAWVSVKNIFDSGVQAAIGALNTLIRAYNDIPLVPDIGEVGGGGKGIPHPRSHTGNAGTGFVQGKARGGFINMGAPTGDTVPAVLERGEYVLNKKAVRAAGGTRALDALNFQMAPRFATGGVAEPHIHGAGRAFQPLVHQEYLAILKAAMGGNRSFQAIVRNANRMDALHQPYLWGGGHGPTADPNGPWDCSGAISELFNGAGWKFAPMVSGGFEGWGASGKGKVSVLANAEHVYSVIGNRAFGTSEENPGGGAGWIGGYTYRPGFAERHAQIAGIGGFGRRRGKGQAQKKGFAAGGLVTGKVSYFGGGTEASGMNTSSPGMALNLNPGTETGWNNATTQKWMDAARGGHPVYGRVSIAGHTANLPITDLGPAGFTQRAIDVTEGGVRKLGFSTSNFPTDAVGRVQILGGGGAGRTSRHAASHAKHVKMFPAGHTGKGGGTYGAAGPAKGGKPHFGPTKEFPIPGFAAGGVPKILQGSGKAIESLFSQPGMGPEERFAASERALEIAGLTGTKADDRALYQFQLGASQLRKREIVKAINKINRALQSNKLTPKQQQKKLRERASLYAELGTAQGRIGSATEGIRGINEEEKSAAQEAAEEAEQKQIEATEALTAAIEEQKAEQAALTEELASNRKLNESELNVSLVVARRALADMISGQIGASTHLASQTAGAGSVGTL